MKTNRIITSRHLLFTVSAAALCTFSVLSARIHAAPPQYSVTVLNFSNGYLHYTNGINASAQVTGYYAPLLPGNPSQAWLWTGTTGTDLSSLGGTNSFGSGINDSGQVAGYSTLTGNAVTHAVRWTGMTPTDLGTLGGNVSEGRDINASGQVAGNSQITGNSAVHAVRWTGTTPTDLGTLGGTTSNGYGINASGQVAGWSRISDGKTHAVRWTGTTPDDLGTLGGTDSYGYDINDSGQVTGYSTLTGTSAYHAVRWIGTTPTDLGTLGGTYSRGFGINNYGDVIGMSSHVDGELERVFIYTDGAMYGLIDLLLPGYDITQLYVGYGGINNSGQIAAFGYGVEGIYHSYVLTPTPEPTSAMLLLSGGALLALRRRHS